MFLNPLLSFLTTINAATFSTNVLCLESKANMAHSQIQKVEANVHIKASADQFHDVLSNRTHHIANIFPKVVKSVEIHKGEWGTEGSIISWSYSHGM